jgi:P4 family phage/plasmid primase-like protien
MSRTRQTAEISDQKPTGAKPLMAGVKKRKEDHDSGNLPERRKINSRRIVEDINGKDRFVFVKDQGRFFRFIRPTWKPLKDIDVLQYIDGSEGGALSPSACKQIFEKLKIVNAGDSHFDRSRALIAFKNGVLDVVSAIGDSRTSDINLLVESHFRRFSSLSDGEIADFWLPETLNAEFDPNAAVSEFSKYLESTFKDCEEQVPVVQEMVGYCMTYDCPIHAWFLLKGPGGNGKSVLLNLIKKLLGDLATHMSFANFNRFSTANLLNKVACISEEMPKRSLDWDLLKDLTGGGYTSAEQKFGPTFSFRATAKFIASTNESPVIADGSEASWQRLVPISFPHAFRNTPRQVLSYDRVLAKEIDGFAYWGLMGLVSLLKRKKFELPDICLEMSRLSRLENDSVRAFVNDRCTLDARCSEYTENLYRAYKSYCVTTGVKPFTLKRFQERVRSQGVVNCREPSNVAPRRHYHIGIGHDFEMYWKGDNRNSVPTSRSESTPSRPKGRPTGFCEFPSELGADVNYCARCPNPCEKSTCPDNPRHASADFPDDDIGL